ncbi:heme ABC exporter ATP-binding protein CcmA [uncultured Lentibacter sp.]|uniref:heme ABC exporter ATP-binding protein CcmA n=1 Tax=uncultured Lentibacter sp. TaxID=1659309 RepID=UPI00260D3CA3|nr:heme ABC exporter ATP-binding protein CcmA [uncultured Lentibacter sp.]
MELVVQDLSVARGGLPVLSGVSFSVSQGQALVLRGPNGIGKTTLLRTLAGLQPALSGNISLDREAMAYAAHIDGIKSTLTVEENLNFWADVFELNEIEHAIACFELGSLRSRPAGLLSAGQKRRLGLARLLVTGRPVWILDEPTVSLDQAAVALFGAAVKAHLAQGGLAIMATHIDLGLEEALPLELGQFRARSTLADNFDEAFL